MGNAIKFTFKGYISLSIDYLNGEFITKVEDTGIGIEEDNI